MTKDSDGWVVGLAWIGDRFAMLNFDERFKSEPLPGYGHHVRVELEILHPNGNGFHDAAEGALLNAMAGRLQEAGGDDAVLVGTVTASGAKRILLYAKRTDWVESWLQEQREVATVRRRVSVKTATDPSWWDYYQLLPFAQRADADGQVYRVLRQHGATTDQAHKVDWLLLFPDREGADAAASLLRESDFEVVVKPAEANDQWLVQATKPMLLRIDELALTSYSMASLADAKGGVYDGWGAEIAP